MLTKKKRNFDEGRITFKGILIPIAAIAVLAGGYRGCQIIRYHQRLDHPQGIEKHVVQKGETVDGLGKQYAPWANYGDWRRKVQELNPQIQDINKIHAITDTLSLPKYE